jgi:hypothetical protein
VTIIREKRAYVTPYDPNPATDLEKTPVLEFFRHDIQLTGAQFKKYGFAPLQIGQDWAVRISLVHQLSDYSWEGVDLGAATVSTLTMSIYTRSRDSVASRNTATLTKTGGSVYQLAVDADQTSRLTGGNRGDFLATWDNEDDNPFTLPGRYYFDLHITYNQFGDAPVSLVGGGELSVVPAVPS